MTLPKLLEQFHHRQVSLFLDLREIEIGVSLDALRSAVTDHLQWR
jgi:hypothetical protein